VDIVVVTSEDVERYETSPVLVIHPALKEGGQTMRGTESSPSEAGRWLEYARSGLILAEEERPGDLLESLCFRTQQAGGKALKALLIHRERGVPYTHDLAVLRRLGGVGGRADEGLRPFTSPTERKRNSGNAL